MGALLLLGQALVFGGCVCLGMFTSATVECSFTPIVVAVDPPQPPAEPRDVEPCDAGDVQA